MLTDQYDVMSHGFPSSQPTFHSMNPVINNLQEQAARPIRRQRSRSEAELPLLLQAQQNASQQHQWQPSYNNLFGARSIDPRSVSSVHSSPNASPALHDFGDDEIADPFDQMRESLIGPRRHSAATSARPLWPYDDGMRSGPVSPISDVRQSLHRSSQSDNFLSQNRSSLLFMPDQQRNHYDYIDEAPRLPPSTGMINMSQAQAPVNYDFLLDSASQQYAYQMRSFPNDMSHVMQPGSSSGAPSPTMSHDSRQEGLPYMESQGGDGAEVLDNPLHWQSQTTKATKQAAAARRKPGTDAKFACEYCGET